MPTPELYVHPGPQLELSPLVISNDGFCIGTLPLFDMTVSVKLWLAFGNTPFCAINVII
jgi:hypothetical protein